MTHVRKNVLIKVSNFVSKVHTGYILKARVWVTLNKTEVSWQFYGGTLSLPEISTKPCEDEIFGLSGRTKRHSVTVIRPFVTIRTHSTLNKRTSKALGRIMRLHYAAVNGNTNY